MHLPRAKTPWGYYEHRWCSRGKYGSTIIIIASLFLQCFACSSIEGVACDETHTGAMIQCPMQGQDTMCRISNGWQALYFIILIKRIINIGVEHGTEFFERSCVEGGDVGCTEKEVWRHQHYAFLIYNLVKTGHDCICKGKGCNENWTSAGDSQDQKTPKVFIYFLFTPLERCQLWKPHQNIQLKICMVVLCLQQPSGGKSLWRDSPRRVGRVCRRKCYWMQNHPR